MTIITKTVHTCPVCNAVFSRYPSQAHKYCSRLCQNAGNSRPIAERLWSKVDKSGGDSACWVWTGCLHTRGYGKIGIDHATVLTHRLAYELTYGPIPEGLEVLHECDNPPCCNPAHLFVGTQAKNMSDMVLRGRSSSKEKHGNAKLTEAKVASIRAQYIPGKIRMRDLAVQFGVSVMTISMVVRHKVW